jgi:hydroxymethylglutaryl-CoA lyase
VNSPQKTKLKGLPDHVTVYEVGPRDGLQNENRVIDAEVKAEFIRRLVGAGLSTIGLTSFVPAKWVPQLADAEELMSLLGDLPGRYPVLVPNERGLERAVRAGANEIAIVASATESFAQRNLNQSLKSSFEVIERTVRSAVAARLNVRGYVSMSFGDPWEGAVPVARVAGIALDLSSVGCTEISLCDTIGVATPGLVVELINELVTRGLSIASVAVHFHDTYGQALANTLVALQCGVTTVDSSAGGIGGCPYAGGATGNLATEDLVWQLEGLGIATGVNLDALCRTSLWMAEQLGRPNSSRTVSVFESNY